nr:MAG TPA: hypothetical protein [Caudoviricetes sp.]DAJ01573.1 MAG TPA: hypothetical protein [Caudoviricetes sp.]
MQNQLKFRGSSFTIELPFHIMTLFDLEKRCSYLMTSS